MEVKISFDAIKDMTVEDVKKLVEDLRDDKEEKI